MRADLTGLSKGLRLWYFRGNGRKRQQKFSDSMDQEMGSPHMLELPLQTWL